MVEDGVGVPLLLPARDGDGVCNIVKPITSHRQGKGVLRWWHIGLLTRWALGGPKAWKTSASLLWFLILILSATSFEVVGYFVIIVTAGFNESIVARDTQAFVKDLWLTLVVFSSLAFILGMKRVSTEMSALQLRRCLVARLHSLYFQDKASYNLLHPPPPPFPATTAAASTASSSSIAEHQHVYLHEQNATSSSSSSHQVEGGRAAIDNPDQRITNDVEMLCTSTTDLIARTFTAPGAMIYYTWYFWYHMGWTGPIACYVFFLVGAGCNALLARNLASLVYRQEKLEGIFRYGHACYRSSIEMIMLWHGQPIEEIRMDKAFDDVVTNRRRIIARHFPLYTSMSFFDYLGSAVVYASVGVSILWMDARSSGTEGEDDASKTAYLIQTGIYASMAIIGSMSRLLDSAEALTDIGGYASRVAQMLEVLEEGEGTGKGKIEPQQRVIEFDGYQEESARSKVVHDVDGIDSDALVAVDGLSLRLPEASYLLQDVSFKVHRGCNLWIRGKSGVGKTSLIRAIAGLWPSTLMNKEYVVWMVKSVIDGNGVMFLPQDTYFFLGTLMDQVLYPTSMESILASSHQGKKTLHEGASRCLREVGLSKYESLLYYVDDWSKRLSRGEAQRIAIARVLYHRPQVVFLDEGTNAMELEAEEVIYAALKSRGITVVSTGHRESLRQYHDEIMELLPAASSAQ